MNCNYSAGGGSRYVTKVAVTLLTLKEIITASSGK
jgi:hypothetical protein